jgi:hypothetical protein
MTTHKFLLICIFAVGGIAHAVPERPESGLPAPPPPPGVTPRESTPPSQIHPLQTEFGDFRAGLFGDIFGFFRYQSAQGQTTNEFDLERFQLGGWVQYKQIAGAMVALETVRSSGSQSYFGIAGDSLVVRAKWAFAEATPLGHWLSIRAGIVPDLLLPAIESSWDFRMQGKTGPERDGFLTVGDLGATIEGALPLGLGSLALQYTNGEGIAQREQNNGKNTTVLLKLIPLRWRLPQLTVQLYFRDGSIGPASAADRRFLGAVIYSGRKFGAGLLGGYAMGYNGDGSVNAGYGNFWARGELPYRFQLFGRADMLWPNASDGGSMQTRLIAGVAYALPMIARIALSYEGVVTSGAVHNATPSPDENAFLISIEGRI